MLDINGQEFNENDLVQLLCQVVLIDEAGVRVRIMNSEQELLISTAEDEVLGLHASPELTKFEAYSAASKVPLDASNFPESDDDEKSAAGIAERMANELNQ